MELETVNDLLEKQNGESTQFTSIFGNRLDCYSEYELPFRYEFLFFEERYLTIKKHMLENNVKRDIVDIGCQLGLQSEIFLDAESYVGIDIYKPSYFMNEEKPNIHYIVGLFPDVNINLENKTVISSMSLGYFDNLIDEDIHKAHLKITEKLKLCPILYIATNKELINHLKPHFNNLSVLQESSAGDFHLYLLEKD